MLAGLNAAGASQRHNRWKFMNQLKFTFPIHDKRCLPVGVFSLPVGASENDHMHSYWRTGRSCEEGGGIEKDGFEPV